MSTVSYGVQLNHLNKCLDPTIRVYRNAIRYLIDIVTRHYSEIKDLSQLDSQQYIENLTHATEGNIPMYPRFDRLFYKFPSYLRRDAINAAIGKVSSHIKLTELWEKNGRKGRRPRMNYNQDTMPCFYRGNMYREENTKHGFQIKVYRNHDWVWLDIDMDRSDMRYIHDYCAELKEAAPVLKKVHGNYVLQFAYKIPHSEDNKFVKDTEVQRALGVDLGLNTDAVCTSVLRDGTVTGCKFIDNPVAKDRLYTLLNVIKGAQQHGSRHMYRLWRYVDNYNREIAIKTAVGIVRYAAQVNAQVIVFENLTNMKGAHGSKKQRISLWRKRDIQSRVEQMAKRLGIRVTYICPWNTSRLAFDGSGAVTRDKDNHALCTFATGKRYNCDLSASKNIAARYFIRAIRKSVPVTEWLPIQAKVPELGTRTRCTLSTLISLSAAV
jgi:IS605 OrfB family transposase